MGQNARNIKCQLLFCYSYLNLENIDSSVYFVDVFFSITYRIKLTERVIHLYMKYLKGYKAVALIEILICICFFLNTWSSTYGMLFNIVNDFGAGILFFGSILAYFESKKWTLWLMVYTMLCLIGFNTIMFIWQGVFLTTGFALIAYDTLFVIANLHFLGKGL